MDAWVTAIDYYHAKSIGDLEACRQAAFAVRDFLTGRYEANQIDGWATYVVTSPKKADEVIILRDFKKVTGGRYPFLFLYIQPLNVPDQELSEISAFVRSHGFEEFTQ